MLSLDQLLCCYFIMIIISLWYVVRHTMLSWWWNHCWWVMYQICPTITNIAIIIIIFFILGKGFFVKAEMHSPGLLVVKRKTRALKLSSGQVQWGETLHFPLPVQDTSFHICAKLYSRTSVRRRHFLGQVRIATGIEGKETCKKKNMLDFDLHLLFL